MTWVQFGSFAVAATTLGGVAWQIYRLEKLQPMYGLSVQLPAGRSIVNGEVVEPVTIRAMGPAVLFEVELEVVGASVTGDLPSYAAWQATSSPATLELRFAPDKHPIVIVAWTTFTRFRSRPIRHAYRFLVSNRRLERWKWSLWPWRARGRWVPTKQRHRGELPTDARIPG